MRGCDRKRAHTAPLGCRLSGLAKGVSRSSEPNDFEIRRKKVDFGRFDVDFGFGFENGRLLVVDTVA